MLAKILHGLCVVLMVLVAALQLNDPDPVIWVTYYLLAAIPSLLALLNRKVLLVNVAVVLFTLFWFSQTGAGLLEYLNHANEVSLTHDMSDDKPYIEEAREFIGAAIVLLLVLLYQFVYRPAGRARQP